MQIEQIRIQGIGPFQEEHTFFIGDGCTLFKGGNETGKTSLAKGIFGALYGFTTRLVEDPEADPSWVELTFNGNGQTYVLHRNCATNRVTLRETMGSEDEILFEGSTQNADEAEAYRTRLALILGEGEGNVWSRSGFVQDSDLPTLLDDTVREWLAGQQQDDGADALLRLEAKLESLRNAGSDSDTESGSWNRKQSDLEKKQDALEQWSVHVRGGAETREALESARAELAEIPEDTREEDAEYLETLERFEALTGERDRLEDEVVALQEEKENIDKGSDDADAARARLEQDYADMIRFPGDLESLIESWMATLERRKDVEKAFGEVDSGPDIADQRPRSGGVMISIGLGALVTLLCYGAGASTLGLILGPVVLVLGMVFFWAQSQNANQLAGALEEERMRLASELDTLDGKIRKIKDSVRDLGEFETPASLRRQFRGFLTAQEKVEQARVVAENTRTLSVIEDDNERVLEELQVVDAKIRDMVAEASFLAGMDAKKEALADELDQARRKVSDTGTRRKDVTEQVEELEAALGNLESELSAPGRLLDDIAELERNEREAARHQKALEIAVSALRKAVEDQPEEDDDRVLTRASRFFQKLSLDRYQGVRLDADLAPEAKSGEDWTPIDNLGRRAQDQLWLSLRLAAHEEAGEQGLPLVLDEPFLGWDDTRLEQAHNILTDLLDSGRQIILFSADSRLAPWTKSVLQLRLPGVSGEFERRAA